MWRRCAILWLSLSLFMAGCWASETPGPAEPTNTAVPARETASVPETPEGRAEPALSAPPDSSVAAPRCFIYVEVSPFAFMPDSTRILIRERAGVRIVNLDIMEDESFLQAPQDLLSAAISPDGEILAWSLADHTIQLIRIADQKVLSTLEGHTLPVLKLRFSPMGDRLFSASYDTWVRVWDREGNLLDAFQPTGADDLPKEIEGIGVSPNGTMLGSIPFDGPAKVWDLTTKKEIANLGGTGGDSVSDIAFSPDGQYVAADQIGRLSLWRASDWKILLTDVSSIAFAFSPDSSLLAYSDVNENYNVFLHPLVGTAPSRMLEGDQTQIYELFFSPDGTLLAAAGAGIKIWETDTGQLSYVGKATCP